MSQPLFELIDPEAYLELARELASRPEIAARRTSADRVYYATFLASRDMLARKGYITPHYSTDDHDYVARTLKRQDVLGSLGNDENRLRRARNSVTYDTRAISAGTQAFKIDSMLQTAEKIIAKVKELPPRNTDSNAA